MDERFYYVDLASLFLELAPRGLQNMADLLYQFAVLGRRYSEPQRHYHNLAHIFHGYHKYRTFFGEWTPVDFFAWIYHDSVYDPKASDNEEQSALVFQKDNYFLGFNPDDADEVTKLILTTKHRGEKNIITDVDLSGLGSSPELYDSNAALIREEYSFANDEEWAAGRIAFLRRFLVDRPVFYTPEFQEAFENKAQENLQRELISLISK